MSSATPIPAAGRIDRFNNFSLHYRVIVGRVDSSGRSRVYLRFAEKGRELRCADRSASIIARVSKRLTLQFFELFVSLRPPFETHKHRTPVPRVLPYHYPSINVRVPQRDVVIDIRTRLNIPDTGERLKKTLPASRRARFARGKSNFILRTSTDRSGARRASRLFSAHAPQTGGALARAHGARVKQR